MFERCTALRRNRLTLGCACLTIVVACGGESGTECTLYRTGLDVPTRTHDETLRIHVATFDAYEAALDEVANANYNLANCDFAAGLFTSGQPHFGNTKHRHIGQVLV